MRPIDRYFGEYGAFHRDPRNEATHALGIPINSTWFLVSWNISFVQGAFSLM